MAELLKVAKAMFQSHKDWINITEEDKEECFFVFNRYFSKKYPEKSQLLNDKLVDKSAAMDLWFYYMKSQPYPKWFWSKSEKDKDKSGYTDKEINELLFKLDITKLELDLLIEYYPELIKEELKYYKDVVKGNK
jgi:hypothetical protein